MSGEAIVVTSIVSNPIGMAVLGSFAGTVAVGVAMQQIVAYRNDQRRKAEQAMRMKKQRIEEWLVFQEQQQKTMQSRAKTQALTLDKVTKLTLLKKSERTLEENTQVQSQGFVPQASDFVHELVALDELMLFCDSLADKLPENRHSELSPFKRLKKQAMDFKTQYHSTSPPLIESLNSFKEMVNMTVHQHITEFERGQKLKQKLLTDCEHLLNEVLEYQALSDSLFLSAVHRELKEAHEIDELTAIEQQLLLMMQKQTVTFSDLDLLTHKFSQIKHSIDTALEHAAIQDSVSASMQKHLEEMGYQQHPDKPDIDNRKAEKQVKKTTWIIPGGEQVQVALHEDHRLAFQMHHERATSNDANLDAQELSFFRQQEKKWCDDLQRLVSKLIADGFQYQVNFERQIPEASVPIVIVDELNDLLEEDQSSLHDKKLRHENSNDNY